MTDRDYGFPFPPYSIQNEFMNSLYDTLSKGKIGIFESPTGTVSLFSSLVENKGQEKMTNTIPMIYTLIYL